MELIDCQIRVMEGMHDMVVEENIPNNHIFTDYSDELSDLKEIRDFFNYTKDNIHNENKLRSDELSVICSQVEFYIERVDQIDLLIEKISNGWVTDTPDQSNDSLEDQEAQVSSQDKKA